MSGETVQIVPVADVEAENGWLRVFHPVASGLESGAQAVWRLRCRSPGVREFTLRLPGANCVHTILVGEVRYEPVRKNCGESVATVVRLAEYRPLAILPARLIGGIPGWSGFLSLVMAAAYLAPKGMAAVVRRLRWVRHRGNSTRRREE
jgi:hypothetical protein